MKNWKRWLVGLNFRAKNILKLNEKLEKLNWKFEFSRQNSTTYRWIEKLEMLTWKFEFSRQKSTTADWKIEKDTWKFEFSRQKLSRIW